MKSVMLIDDNQWFVQQFAREVNQIGMRCIYASSAIGAIDIIDDDRPDCIVTDILLPGINGVAFLNEIASHDDLSRIPIIVVSSIGDEIRGRLDSYPVSSVIDKSSIKPGDISRAIERCV
ncbi:response regulator [Candidatus Nomurabacteria bacterium]|nr:response regulator [Candidatus Nomurabacteria bacterium]